MAEQIRQRIRDAEASYNGGAIARVALSHDRAALTYVEQAIASLLAASDKRL